MLKPTTIATVIQWGSIAVLLSADALGLPEKVGGVFCLVSLSAFGFCIGWRKREKKGGE